MAKHIIAESINLIIADPPFGIKFKANRGNYNRDGNLVVDGYIEIPIEEYRDFSVEWIKEAYRVLHKTGTMYVFSGWNNLEHILYALRIAGFVTINHILWKYQFPLFTKRRYVTSHYHILFVSKHKIKYFFNKVLHYPQDIWKIKKYEGKDIIDFREVSDDWEYEEDGDPDDFWVIKRPYNKGIIKVPNKLPPKLVRKILLFSSKEGDIILDPFGGGGGSAIGVIKLNRETGKNRKYVIIEKSKPMYDFILDQIEEVQKEVATWKV